MGELADPGKRSSNLVKWADEVGRGLVKIKCFNVEDEATSLTAGKYQICDHLDGGGNGEQKKGKKFEPGIALGRRKKIHKRIERADEVGRDLLKTIRSNEDDEGTIPASGKGNNREPNEITNDGQLQSKSRGVPGRQRCGERKWGEGGSTNCSSVNRGSFKDVLMRRLTPISSATNPQLPYPHSPPSQPTRRRTPPHRPVKRCYRCLASDHTVATCRDPVRCYRCGKTGHRAHYCKRKFGANAGMMNRAVNHRGRAPVAKVFVPYTDEYFRRVELRRNAILADVIQPANLGPDPISTIKTALASRFGDTRRISPSRVVERGTLPYSCLNVFQLLFLSEERFSLSMIFGSGVGHGVATGMLDPIVCNTKHGSALSIFPSKFGRWHAWRH
uniref:CCHC-type domain-containing protein n=1 Tax=Ananas comosus var. bracteatus TaxID=296719 RepID=A0A6V7PW10_ANACO|nr:unnamed protein product [Ananas comosus var. bracteatus]